MTIEEFKSKWKSTHLLKPEDRPAFEEAAIMATTLPHKQWTYWLNHTKNYRYAFVCKMAKEVGLCTPGHAFYPKMRKQGQLLLDKTAQSRETTHDDDLLWKQ